jgi:hypothetical protein
MTSRDFLNAAHAALVEEFMRPRSVGTVSIPGMSLTDALEAASPWAEGFRELPVIEDEDRQPARPSSTTPRPKSEEEIVAQNNQALQWVTARMSRVKGGFSTVPSKG